MSERRILSTWKDIASYLGRSVRTVQRWEVSYNLPIHRPNNDTQSVFACSDEIDDWMQRARPRKSPYVRPTFIVLDVISPGAISELKLSLEGAKFNVLPRSTLRSCWRPPKDTTWTHSSWIRSSWMRTPWNLGRNCVRAIRKSQDCSSAMSRLNSMTRPSTPQSRMLPWNG